MDLSGQPQGKGKIYNIKKSEENVIVNRLQKKAAIKYPCRWLYKVIGPDQELIRVVVRDIVRDRPCDIIPSNTSSSGKYHCLDVEVYVTDEEGRNEIYAQLKAHAAIKMVL